MIRIATTMGHGHQESRSLQFFLEKTLVQFQTYFPDSVWETYMLRRASSEGCIRHALIALSAFHEHFVLGHVQDNVFALRQYNLAIQGLTGDDQQPTPQTSLLSCLIFIYIETLRGHYTNIFSLFKSGCKILQELEQSQQGCASKSAEAIRKPEVQVDDITHQGKTYFYRLGVQILLFQGDIVPGIPPASILAYLKPTLQSSNGTEFKSFSEAKESLQDLYLQQFEIVMMNAAEHAAFAQKLKQWYQRFQELIASKESISALSAADKRTIALLEVHRQDIALNLKVVTPGTGEYGRNQMKWDAHVDDFSRMVDNAAIALGSDDFTSRGKHQFHLHFGVTSILESVTGRCRDPSVRRRALALMTARPVQEGIMSSDLAVRTLRRLVTLEEGSTIVRTCEDVPEEARVVSSDFGVSPCGTQVMVRFGFRHGSFEETFETSPF